MKKVALGLSAAVLAIAGAAYAQQSMRPKPDADGNGIVTRAEMQAHSAQMFAKMDANKDGKIDAADREARQAAMFDMIDSDKNGQISRAEFTVHHGPGHRMQGEGGEGHRGMGAGMGAGMGEGMGEGMGSHRGGHRGGHGGGGMMARMADTNNDGAVSQAEFTAAAVQRFDRIDANKDGQITAEERQAGRAAMRERWREHKGHDMQEKSTGESPAN